MHTKIRVGALIAGMLTLLFHAFAAGQTPPTLLGVDLAKAKIYWEYVEPVPLPPSVGKADGFNVKCGTTPTAYSITKAVAVTERNLPLQGYLPGPGTYWCTVTAFNPAGESGAPPAINFRTDYVPATPRNLSVGVQGN